MDKALTRLHSSREHEHDKEADGEELLGPLKESSKQHQEIGVEPSNLLVTSTVSVPEVSLVPSPEVSKVRHYKRAGMQHFLQDCMCPSKFQISLHIRAV